MQVIYGKICDVETGKVAHGLLGMYGQDFCFGRARAAGAFFFNVFLKKYFILSLKKRVLWKV